MSTATTALSPADVAAHQGDSAPSVDEALRRGRSAERRRRSADQIVGFRIMRTTEIAPGWWGKAVEVGETVSGTVAYNFCREQNAETMNLNRRKMIEFFAEPIYAAPALSDADVAAHEAASYVRTVRRDDSTLDVSEDLRLTAASVEVAA